MAKLYVTYNPHATNVHLLPDAGVEPYVTDLVGLFNDNKDSDKDMYLIFAQDILLLTLRVMISEGKLDHERVKLIFEGESVPIDSDGRINKWPQGMGDYELNLLSRLC